MRNFKIFNEKVYLDQNPYRVRKNNIFFQNAQIGFIDAKEKESHQNAEALELYNQYTRRLASFIKGLNIGKNDLERAMIFRYMLNNKYFSNGLSLNDQFFRYCIGANTLFGNNNPYSNSKIYYDTFKEEYDYPLEYPCFKSNKPNTLKAKNGDANYAVNIVFYNNEIYGYDIKSGRLYICSGPFEMRSMEEESTRFLRFKPFYELVSKSQTIKTIEDIMYLLHLFEVNAEYSYSSIVEIKEIEKEVQKAIDMHIIDFENFKKETTPIISSVQDKVLSKK